MRGYNLAIQPGIATFDIFDLALQTSEMIQRKKIIEMIKRKKLEREEN